MYICTYGQTDFPCVLQDFVPFGAAAQKNKNKNKSLPGYLQGFVPSEAAVNIGTGKGGLSLSIEKSRFTYKSRATRLYSLICLSEHPSVARSLGLLYFFYYFFTFLAFWALFTLLHLPF